LKLAFNRYCLHLNGSLAHPILSCKAVLEGRGFKPIFSMIILCPRSHGSYNFNSY
jgi:hypothetical protein